MASFGGAVKLTGESEYRAALRNISQNLKEVSSELKLVSSQYDKNDTSKMCIRDRLSTAQKLEGAGYNTVEIRQHSSVLHPPTKLLKEKILCGEFEYTDNKLLEINFQNARCSYDTNKNMYVHKKKSKGKVDMVVSLINAVYLSLIHI